MRLLRVNDGRALPEALALVDSGADKTIFPGDWAKALGIDLDKDCEQVPGTTAGGTTTNFTYEPGVEVIFMGKKIKLFATFNRGLPVILLGREDFFAAFRITFDQKEKSLEIAEYEVESVSPDVSRTAEISEQLSATESVE